MRGKEKLFDPRNRHLQLKKNHCMTSFQSDLEGKVENFEEVTN
jgi:hypothetical protein